MLVIDFGVVVGHNHIRRAEQVRGYLESQVLRDGHPNDVQTAQERRKEWSRMRPVENQLDGLTWPRGGGNIQSGEGLDRECGVRGRARGNELARKRECLAQTEWRLQMGLRQNLLTASAKEENVPRKRRSMGSASSRLTGSKPSGALRLPR